MATTTPAPTRRIPPTFRADVSRTRLLLEDIGGVAVHGYRAATFSIGARNPWAFRVLESAGYTYSSSVNPIRHDLYGMPDAPRVPFRPGGGALWEFPMTTVRAFGRNWPCSGGGYFRLLPYALFRRGLSLVNQREQRPGHLLFPSLGESIPTNRASPTAAGSRGSGTTPTFRA